MYATKNLSDRAVRYLLTIAVPALALPLATAQTSNDPCKRQAYGVLKSCEREALADYWLARAKCENLPTAAQRMACFNAAANDLDDFEDECDEQYQERKEICTDLGGGFYNPDIDPDDFVEVIDNPYLPMIPGTTFVYEKVTPEGVERTDIVITDQTKEILGVECTVVHDIVSIGGDPIEDTIDWFAQDDEGNVWYMGESVQDYDDTGRVVSVDGSWVAGENGAKPGIVMPADLHVGDLYRQEYLLGDAEDLFEILSLNRPVTVPYGFFPHCLKTEDFSPLSPESEEHKFYSAGVGRVLELNVQTGEQNKLIAIEFD